MKTTTLTIRLSADDKDLLQAAARSRGQTVTEYLLRLIYADTTLPSAIATDSDITKAQLGDLRSEVNQLTADLQELRTQITALSPQRINQEIQEIRQMMEVIEDQAAPTPAPSKDPLLEFNTPEFRTAMFRGLADLELKDPPESRVFPQGPPQYFAPGCGPDCNQSCQWFAAAPKRCRHPDFADVHLEDFRVIPGDCPNYEPNREA